MSFLDLCAREGIELRRSGTNFVGRCPFHEERSASFTVHGPAHDHGHCYGCGWNGDVFDLWRERRGGVGFVDAVAAVASLASLSPLPRIEAARVPRMTQAEEEREKPALPRLRAMRDDEVVALARMRQISVEGIEAAAALKRVAVCEWPQFIDRNGAWGRYHDATPCWVVTDGARAVAQFRRLDGEAFTRADGKSIKAWTRGSPTWPIGAGEIGSRGAVLLVEGGADMLAAYHFLALFGRLEEVAVCAMLGASMRIAEDALGFFTRKRVRVVMDDDEPKGERGIRPGCEAAARWTAQLAGAGAAVETFSLAGLRRRDGERVKDLNDLAVVDEAAWLDAELREAFVDFDF